MKTFEQQTAHNKSPMFLQQLCLGKESLNPLRITRNCDSKVQNFPHLMQVMYRYIQALVYIRDYEAQLH